MPELVATGNVAGQNWSRTLPAGPVTLGRSTTLSDWSVPWDPMISKRHATLVWSEGRLAVRRDPAATNAIFVRGEASDDFSIGVGEMFVIGNTLFSVREPTTVPKSGPAPAPGPLPTRGDLPTPLSELTCSREELDKHTFTDAGQRIEVLAALPALIRDSPSDIDLETRVIEALLRGIPRADIAAVVRRTEPRPGEEAVEVRAWSARGFSTAEFRPSRRLVRDSVARLRQSVLHLWRAGDPGGEFTMAPGFDWSLCAPLPDDPDPGWALYVSGGLAVPARATAHDDQFKSDLKFAELVADIFGACRQVRDLQYRESRLGGFLSRPVLAALSGRDIDTVLAPRETDVTVLFCDLRSSCRIVEEGQADLPALWERINEALGNMTNGICDQDGVIGDFQGDAAMGFWGWPLDDPDQIERAARAALAIRRRFAHQSRQKDHPLAGVSCGIGIAHGRAIAGRLGTADQFKVGVFGPVVNLASRLESLTKRLGVSILIDEHVAARLADPRHAHWVRVRRLARVLPFGLRTPLTLSELLPPAVEPGTIAERHRRDSEAALDAFLAGRWPDARRLLDRLPRDGTADLVRSFMDRNPQGPPEPWDGAIPMEGK